MIAVVLRFGRPWTVLALVVLSACRSAVDPESWSKTDRTGYLGLESSLASSVPGAGAPAEPFTQGMVAGSTNPFAVHAGLEMLKSGGSAADAALNCAHASGTRGGCGSQLRGYSQGLVLRREFADRVFPECGMEHFTERKRSAHDSRSADI
jgi:hypothetical protein